MSDFDLLAEAEAMLAAIPTRRAKAAKPRAAPPTSELDSLTE